MQLISFICVIIRVLAKGSVRVNNKQTNWLFQLAALHTSSLEFKSTKQSYRELSHICFASHAAAFIKHEYTDKEGVFMRVVMNTKYSLSIIY